MDWRRNIVRILMLATLVVAASAPAKAARPGVFLGRKPPRIPQVVNRPVQRPPVQNNWNPGSLRRGHGYGRVNTGNAEHMRPTGNINRGQIHPRPGYDSYPYRSKPGSSNMGTIGSSTRDRAHGKSVRNAASNTIEKPVTAATFSKNKYQKSSNTNDKIIRTIERLRTMLDIPEAEKEVGRSYPNSDQEESTAMKITNVNAGDGKKPWVMVTTPDWTWYFEIEGTWYVVRFIGSTQYWQTIPSTNSSQSSNDEEGIRRRGIMRLIDEDLRKAPKTRRREVMGSKLDEESELYRARRTHGLFGRNTRLRFLQDDDENEGRNGHIS